MKKWMMVAVALSMMSMAFASDKKADAAKSDKMGKAVSVAGIVTDPMCAKSKDKAKMMDSDCAKKCAKDGKLAFVADSDGKVWSVQNPEALKGHEGHHVTVKGHLNDADSSIHVVSASMKAEKKAAKKEMKEEKKS